MSNSGGRGRYDDGVARRSAAERAEEIRRAAIELATERGFAAVTTREVAARLGVAHGLIHHYVPSRDALVAEAFDLAVRDEVAHYEEECRARPDPVVRMRYLLTPARVEHYLLWMDAWSEANRNPALMASLRRHNRAFERMVVEAVQDGVRDGRFTTDDPRRAARRINAFADGVAVHAFVLGVFRAGASRPRRCASPSGSWAWSPAR